MSSPHDSAQSTREISYERLRKEGIPRESARKIADEVARRVHDQHSRDKRREER